MDEVLRLIGELGESSLQSSRKFVVGYVVMKNPTVDWSKTIDMLKVWQNQWLGIRMNIYKFYLTKREADRINAVNDVLRLMRVDENLWVAINSTRGGNVYEHS